MVKCKTCGQVNSDFTVLCNGCGAGIRKKAMPMVTDEQIEKAFAGTNFGPDKSIEGRRKYLAQSIFKIASGYATGSTISQILQVLGFLKSSSGKPRKKAKQWAYDQIFTEG